MENEINKYEIEIIKTHDNSHTLFHHQFKERYHSIHGAINESKHVFINKGLKIIDKEPIKVFEFGFGTGLNALLTLIYSNQHQLKIDYNTIEAYPLETEKIKKLNYLELLKVNELEEDFLNMHYAKDDETLDFGNMNFLKSTKKWEDFHSEKKFDLVYYDAFAPNVQPELWTVELFQKMYEMMEQEGILVTYCAKGYVKRNLKAAGFIIESIEGPPGKREMTRAVKL